MLADRRLASCEPAHTTCHHARAMDDALHPTPNVAIPLTEVALRTTRSSGPGGQHANVTDSRVEASFDVAASGALSDAQKARVVARVGPVVRAVAQDARSQLRNRELALERLEGKLRQALHVDRPRRATKPSRGAKQRRLDAKKQLGQRKAGRQRPRFDD
ncbi:Peptide chain release factor 2 [Paraconexibacter sp. AEG42_29]|uniref:Peptide chain release factor 2 n=1 Tax=Paraconexibacter sp. AEG42_29 TaxID=2997339 RepID=A0AAU7B013_9ACTN